MNITPEQLKVIAESQGYEAIIENNNGLTSCLVFDETLEEYFKYNPLENDYQALSLNKWLLRKNWLPDYNEDICSYGFYNYNFTFISNKSFKHAVIEAVIKELGL